MASNLAQNVGRVGPASPGRSHSREQGDCQFGTGKPEWQVAKATVPSFIGRKRVVMNLQDNDVVTNLRL